MKLRLATLCLIILNLFMFTTLFAQNGKLKISTSSPEAQKLYYQARMELEKENAQAIPELARRALKVDPDFAMGLMLLSVLANGATADSLLGVAIEKGKKNATAAEVSYIEAVRLQRKQDMAGATKILDQLISEFPKDRDTMIYAAQLHQALKNYDKAEEYLKKGIELDGSTPRGYRLLAGVYQAAGKPDKVSKILQTGIKNAGESTGLYQASGTAALLQENYEEARNYYKKAIKMIDRDATPFVPFFGYAWTHMYEGNPDDALKIIDKFLARYNRNGAAQGFPPVWIWNQIGRIHLENGRLEEAMIAYKTGYKSVPPSQISDARKKVWEQRSNHGQARTLAKMGKHEDAMKIVNKMEKLLNSEATEQQRAQFEPAFHYLAGYVMLEANKLEAAIEHLRKTSEQNAFHLLLLARAYEKSGDTKNALAKYKAITKMNRNNVERALSYPEAKKKVAALSSK